MTDNGQQPTSADLPDFEPGWVWLVGAGPGDPGLITLLAHHGLSQADVVVYDALVDERVLAMARLEAELIYAGKRGGKPSPRQPDISKRLIQLARQGKRVLRLKGGDPLIFGRGGEEALALVAADVPFRIVPGITAGVGGLAYAGIPTTHRDTNQTVTFVTGHAAGGDMPDAIDWASLAKGSGALVFYMALKHLERIAGQLMVGGLDAATPVAVVAHATTADQQVLETQLDRVAADVVAHGIDAPAVIAIGEIVRLRAGLDWLGALDGRVLDANPLGLKSDARAG